MSNQKNPYEVTSWGQDSGLFDIELPSGQVCQARKLEMEDIIRLGLINDLDTFTTLYGDEDEIKQTSDIDFIKKISEGDGFGRLLNTLNLVTIECVVQPQVWPVPDQKKERKSNRVYIDAIKFEDKMFIFSKVFTGMSAMADFREEPGDDLGAVESKPEPEVSSV
ncbi:tail assembly chaperone [Gordonia phage DumpTruck]|nr:tail assembly chaperone [Gordonia phage DumpTruck]